jgi:putative transposase
LRAFNSPDARLKKLLAETMLDVAVLKDITSRKW